MAIPLSKLSKEVLEDITPKALQTTEIPKSKKQMVLKIKEETETAGVKELAFMLNNLELRDICDNTLQVEYKEGANKKNKMMLTKRFMESFEEDNVEGWVAEHGNREVLQLFLDVMGIEYTKKTSIQDMQAAVTRQIRIFGESVILYRMTVSQLKDIHYEMGLDGYDNTTSKRILVEAIINGTDIEKREAPKRKITKKVSIAKATTNDQLSQHYKAMDLEEWCRKNGLKTSGTKKILIERILAFNDGDTENTMATSPNVTRKNKKGGAKPKKATAPKKKKQPEPEPEPESEDEDEQEIEEVSEQKEPEPEASEEASVEENSYDEEAEKAAIDAERALRQEDDEDNEESEEEADTKEKEVEEEAKEDEDEDEDEEDVEIEISVSQSAEKENEYPTEIEGLIFAISGKFTRSKKEIQEAITEAGGIVKSSLSKKTDVFICTPDSKAYKSAQKFKIRCEGEEYLTNFYKN